MLLLSLALLAAPTDTVVVRDIEVAPGETLRTTTIGAGEPLVLIPGIFGAAFGYRLVVGPLVARGYRCIVVEPLGYGWSSHPKSAPRPSGWDRRSTALGSPAPSSWLNPAALPSPSGSPSRGLACARPPVHRRRPGRERGDPGHAKGISIRRAGGQARHG